MKSLKPIRIGILLITLILASCDSFSAGGDPQSLSIVISNPVGDVTVSLGETVGVTSTAVSEAGISQVQLLVNGQVTASTSPQEPGAEMFVALTSWVPTSPGIYQLSVAVQDVGNQRVESSKLTVTVQESASEEGQEEGATSPSPTATEAAAATDPPAATDPLPTATNPPPQPTSTQAQTSGRGQPTPTIGIVLAPMPAQINPVSPSALVAVHFEMEDYVLDPNEDRGISAICPPGTLVTGGGFLQGGTANNVERSLMTSNNGWMIAAHNYGDEMNLMEAYAVCLSNSGGSILTAENVVNVPANSDQVISVMCPAGSVVTGGGWQADDLYIIESVQSGNGWFLQVENPRNSPADATVQVICLSGTNATSSNYRKTVVVSAESFNYAFAFCDSGQLIAGGGFSREMQSKYGMPIYVDNHYGWGIGAQNYYVNSSKEIQASATCLSFP